MEEDSAVKQYECYEMWLRMHPEYRGATQEDIVDAFANIWEDFDRRQKEIGNPYFGDYDDE